MPHWLPLEMIHTQGKWAKFKKLKNQEIKTFLESSWGAVLPVESAKTATQYCWQTQVLGPKKEFKDGHKCCWVLGVNGKLSLKKSKSTHLRIEHWQIPEWLAPRIQSEALLCEERWIFNKWEEVSQGTDSLFRVLFTPLTLMHRGVFYYILFSQQLSWHLFSQRGSRPKVMIMRVSWVSTVILGLFLSFFQFQLFFDQFRPVNKCINCHFHVGHPALHFHLPVHDGYLPTIAILLLPPSTTLPHSFCMTWAGFFTSYIILQLPGWFCKDKSL